jgi:hypothetical protein
LIIYETPNEMNKNTILTVLIPLLTILVMWGCEKEDISKPRACFTAEVTEANVGEPITFTNCGEGKAFSIWTGDSYHAYANYGTDAGVSFEGETFSYAYPEPGTFTVTMVATSYGNQGQDVYEDVDSMAVSITDNRAEFLEFGFRSPKVVGTIEGHDIFVEVPYGTDFTNLKATFKTSSKFSVVTVDGVEQVTGKTANDFTNPVEFTITAQTGDQNIYMAQVYTIPDTAKELTVFSINNIPGVFEGKTIRVTMPAGDTIYTNIRAQFETSSEKTVVTVNGVVQVSGSSKNDFTDPVEYVVTAEDETFNTYTVIVEEEMGFLSFGFEQLVPAVYANISGYNLSVKVLQGTPVDSLVASFVTTSHNPTVKIGDVVQTSGITLNDFTDPVTYTLETEDKSVDYTITVTVIE